MKMVPKMDPRVDSFGSCFQKKRENRKVRFDCTGAYGLHVSSRRGAPKATQNYTQKQDWFQKPFFRASFFGTQSRDFQWKRTRNGPQSWLFWELFLEKERKGTSAFRLHRRLRIAYEPTPWNAPGDSKWHKKKTMLPYYLFSRNDWKINENWHPKGVQMGECISG